MRHIIDKYCNNPNNIDRSAIEVILDWFNINKISTKLYEDRLNRLQQELKRRKNLNDIVLLPNQMQSMKTLFTTRTF